MSNRTYETAVLAGFNHIEKQLTHLREVGRDRGEAWLTGHFDQIGRESTDDIRAKYL